MLRKKRHDSTEDQNSSNCKRAGDILDTPGHCQPVGCTLVQPRSPHRFDSCVDRECATAVAPLPQARTRWLAVSSPLPVSAAGHLSG